MVRGGAISGGLWSTWFHGAVATGVGRRCTGVSPAEEFGFGAGAFEIEHLGSSRPFSGAAVLAPATAQADPRRGPLAALQMRCKNIDTLLLGTPGILCSWGTAGIFCGWALQGYSAVGHCRDTFRLGTARDTLRLGTSVKHCRDTHWLGITWWLVTKVRFQSGEDNIYSKI